MRSHQRYSVYGHQATCRPPDIQEGMPKMPHYRSHWPAENAVDERAAHAGRSSSS